MKLSLARSIAEGLMFALAPACDQIEIAGSIRRANKPEVKDIEIVCVPKMEVVLDENLLGETLAHRHNLLNERLAEMVRAGSLERGDKNGDRYKTFFVLTLDDRIKVDLFIVLPPAQWGVILALRTGPAEFSKWLVTGESQGGALPVGMGIESGRLLKPGEVVPTPTERDFFATIGLEWIEPGKREARWTKRGSA